MHQESHETEAWHTSVAGRKWGRRRLTAQSQESPWHRRPSKGPWLPAGKNARASGSGVKAELSRETPRHRLVTGHFRKLEAPPNGVVSFYGLGKFHWVLSGKIIPTIWEKGRSFQELGHHPLFGLSWLASDGTGASEGVIRMLMSFS